MVEVLVGKVFVVQVLRSVLQPTSLQMRCRTVEVMGIEKMEGVRAIDFECVMEEVEVREREREWEQVVEVEVAREEERMLESVKSWIQSLMLSPR